MPFKDISSPKLKVAIIGGGPAGLGAAIEFSKLPFVEWNLYEQASAIREIGAGISVQRSTWRMLEVMGAAQNLTDIFRPADGHHTQHRNGRTGDLVLSVDHHGVPYHQTHARTHRAKLQLALLKEVNPDRIRLLSRLSKVEKLPSGRLLIKFEDGFKDEVDLLVGADGVRSVVRNFAFPNHRTAYTGKTSYRAVVSTEEIAKIPGVPQAITFWHGPQGWLYTCPLGNNQFEITTMTNEANERERKEKVSWGQDASIEDNLRHFKDFAPVCQEVMKLPTNLKQYALFSGPRLHKIVAYDRVALIGDASHPLSGAFGTGAGFALEDVYALTRGVAWAYKQNRTLGEGLELFDAVRGPHYENLYNTIDKFAKEDRAVLTSDLGFDDKVLGILETRWNSKYDWIFDYDIQAVFEDYVRKRTSQTAPIRETAHL